MIRVSFTSILPGSSIVISIKQKLMSLLIPSILHFAHYNPQSFSINPKLDKKQYTPSFSSNN